MNTLLRQPAGCLVVDPPWSYRDALPGPKRGAASHYKTMTVDDICRLVLPPLADDCWLFLWRVHTHQREALQVAKAWGFGDQPCSELVWVKLAKNGKPRRGMGWTFRMGHEVCLVFKRGKPQRVRADLSSVILAPLGRHSEKPAAFREHVDNLDGPVPRVELFARRQWPNWLCVGDEMGVTP